MSTFTPTTRSNPCPICANDSGKCRTFADSPIVLCMTADQRDSVPDYRYSKPSKDGLWGVWAPDDLRIYSEAEKQQWQLEQQDRRNQAQKAPPATDRPARDQAIREFLTSKSDGTQALLQRGLTSQQAARITDLQITAQVQPGDSISFENGSVVKVSGAGLAIAAQWIDLTLSGAQIRLDSAQSGGRYRALSADGCGQCDGLPLVTYFDCSPGGSEIWVIEGLLKPAIAWAKLQDSQQWGNVRAIIGTVTIGAAANNQNVGRAIAFAKGQGASQVVICPDAGMGANPKIHRAYAEIAEKWGASILYWGQAASKDLADIDEIDCDRVDLKRLAWAEYDAIARSIRPLKSAQNLEAVLGEPPNRKQKALQVIDRLNRLSYPVERATEGEYLPALPPLQPGAIHVLNASMNAGKTTRIGEDWVKAAIAQGQNVLVLAPLNSLGEQTAQDWGLPHIHTYGTSADQQKALWADVSHSHGVVMCPDSLHRLLQQLWFFDRPLLLILDEANQGVNHMAQGDTLKSRQAEILECFTHASRHAIATGAIVLSEDGLPDRAVKFVQQVSGGATVRTFTHQKQGQPWNCKLYRGQASGYRARFLERLQTGQPMIFVASSQAEAERMERAIARRYPGRRVDRIDSKTNQGGRYSQFFANPDEWIQQNRPDVLILSPSVKSGVSIEGGVSAENAYFKEVWGYCPILDTDTHAQLLGRYRPPVPRVVFCPDFVLTSGDESLLYPRAIKRRLHSNAAALAGVYGLEEMLEAGEDRAELLATIEIATLDYLAEAIAVSGAQKQIAHQALVRRLEQAGHCVVSEQIAKDSDTAALWKAIQEEIWREDAAAIASSVISPEVHTLKWARQTLESLEASLDDRTLARKVLWREEFPGVGFDDSEEVYQALVKDYGAMRHGVTLQAKAENLEAAREDDRAAVEAILKGDIQTLHRLPKGYVRARLIAQTGILNLLEKTYSNTDPRAIAVKVAALKFAREISYWLRLHVKETQTPVEIVNKLLKKLGLEATAVSRPGARGQQNDRVYQVAGQDNPIRVRLLEALRRKLSISVSTIRKEENQSIQIVDTAPEKPPDIAEWLTLESLADLAGIWKAATTEEMRADVRAWVPPEVLRRAIA
jgi:hypothetical protein